MSALFIPVKCGSVFPSVDSNCSNRSSSIFLMYYRVSMKHVLVANTALVAPSLVYMKMTNLLVSARIYFKSPSPTVYTFQ